MRLTITLSLVFVLGLQSASALAAAAEDTQRRGVRWGNRHHADSGSLASWLAARGASYAVWAERHPLAAARLERQTVHAFTDSHSSGASQALGRALLAGLAIAGAGALAFAWLLAVPPVAFRLGLAGVSERRVDIALFGLVLISAAAVVYAVNTAG